MQLIIAIICLLPIVQRKTAASADGRETPPTGHTGQHSMDTMRTRRRPNGPKDRETITQGTSPIDARRFQRETKSKSTIMKEHSLTGALSKGRLHVRMHVHSIPNILIDFHRSEWGTAPQAASTIISMTFTAYDPIHRLGYIRAMKSHHPILTWHGIISIKSYIRKNCRGRWGDTKLVETAKILRHLSCAYIHAPIRAGLHTYMVSYR